MMLGMARTISMAVEDLYDATAFIVDKADEWGIDSSQIVACGSSAGAITVLHGEYALCNASPLVQHLPVGFRYAGIVSFAGAIFEMGEEPPLGIAACADDAFSRRCGCERTV